MIGRVVPSYFADRTGPLNLLIPTCLAASIMVLSWIAIHESQQLYVWACFYGMVAGAIMSLYPAGLPSLIPDLQSRGSLIGLNFTVVSFAVLIGNPIGGALIAADNGSYTAAQIFMGINFLIGMALVYLARTIKQRKEGISWWSKI
jgi:MFS family permease